jgi:hypothetical protein
MTAARTLTLVDDWRPVVLPVAGDRLRILRDAAHAALGHDPGSDIDLDDLARVLGRPLAVDADEGAAFLGTSADVRAATLRTLAAPDFALPDLDGRIHRLADHRGRKVVLVAYASW